MLKTIKLTRSIPHKLVLRGLSNVVDPQNIHFKATGRPHPLFPNTLMEDKIGDHSGLQQNHIWSEAEIDGKMKKLYHYKPKTIGDRIVQTVVSKEFTFFIITS
jgi:hypothetical protein